MMMMMMIRMIRRSLRVLRNEYALVYIKQNKDLTVEANREALEDKVYSPRFVDATSAEEMATITNPSTAAALMVTSTMLVASVMTTMPASALTSMLASAVTSMVTSTTATT